ncbi:hypothetical protein BKN38_07760 [Helicobacter sp. CLO-3]|uniref:hypothetical protein n=1 Tax=unclassified Helicobacter TaxID=2593540 RepID=UPI000805EE02|nr:MULTISPECIES: hypothetical protein [unclassified Helicobacter]OBV28361.1 hypothetical protein BA723_09695 [Helicobacter sp. CLO-3]OHU82039.1 hypothetical protein BKN38_07760 [Helicobacter sp. CLO-3]
MLKELKTCYKCIIILGSINLIAAFLLYFFLRGWMHAISFEAAYFSTFLVVISSYYTLKKRLDRDVANANTSGAGAGNEARADSGADSSLDSRTPNASQTPESSASTAQDFKDSKDASDTAELAKPSPVSKFFLGIQLSFGLYRLASYIILGALLVVLMDSHTFSVIGYIAGVMVCLLSVILFRIKHPPENAS